MLSLDLHDSLTSLIHLLLQIGDDHFCIFEFFFGRCELVNPLHEVLTLLSIVLFEISELDLGLLVLVSNSACLGLNTGEVLTEARDLLVLQLSMLSKRDQLGLVPILFLLYEIDSFGLCGLFALRLLRVLVV